MFSPRVTPGPTRPAACACRTTSDVPTAVTGDPSGTHAASATSAPPTLCPRHGTRSGTAGSRCPAAVGPSAAGPSTGRALARRGSGRGAAAAVPSDPCRRRAERRAARRSRGPGSPRARATQAQDEQAEQPEPVPWVLACVSSRGRASSGRTRATRRSARGRRIFAAGQARPHTPARTAGDHRRRRGRTYIEGDESGRARMAMSAPKDVCILRFEPARRRRARGRARLGRGVSRPPS